MRRLVLFDIDGTLLRSDGAGRRAMERALTHVFGTPGSPGYHYDGKTDRQIVREMMRLEGHEDAHIDRAMERLMPLYLDGLRAELAPGAGRAEALPGVPALLDALEARDDVVLGLLTGNLADGAAVKLAAAGIDIGRFRVNAFGSDEEHRPRLPAVAQARARELLGIEVHGERVVIIGDTPHDIECGRDIGARAIAVATGRFDVEALRSHRPAAVFADLTDTAAVVAAVVEER
ncbi:MAG TPA: HAD hydrolase-like protein [Gemmatimonadaceae bacterium]|nr:HAD hydrolase-like protein [Gemmatimonadaceae bacterium]